MAKLIDVVQGTEEWLKARTGIATASNFYKILAKTKTGYSAMRYTYMSEVVSEILTGEYQTGYSSSAMEWGINNEPVAKLEYSLITGNEVQNTGIWVDDELMAGASPDGLIDDDGIIEIKCPNTSTHINTLKTKAIPKMYVAQIQGQLLLTGRKWCDYVSFDPRLPQNAQICVIRVLLDKPYMIELKQELIRFKEEVNEQVNFVKEYK